MFEYRDCSKQNQSSDSVMMIFVFIIIFMGYFDCILALLNLCSNLRVILMFLNACLMMLACVYCTFQCNLF